MTTPSIHRSDEPADVPDELREARKTIDNVDAALVHILAERFRCTQRVGVLKANLDLPSSDPAREERQVARLRALAEEAGLDPVFAEKFLKFIVEEVIRHHDDIADTMAGARDGSARSQL
ncbi:MAG: chorismate mutase [Georgenia sp.]